MPAVELRDFRPTAEQRRFFEGNALPIGWGIHMLGGRTGKRRALEFHIKLERLCSMAEVRPILVPLR